MEEKGIMLSSAFPPTSGTNTKMKKFESTDATMTKHRGDGIDGGTAGIQPVT